LLYWDSDGSTTAQVRREDHLFDDENQLQTRYEITLPSGPTAAKNYDYDVNGNLVESDDLGILKVDIESRIYEWDTWRYRYDPFGRRVEKREVDGTFWLRFYYRPGAPRRHADEAIKDLIDRTLTTKPKGARHWSSRAMAAARGMSQATVGRVWRAFGL